MSSDMPYLRYLVLLGLLMGLAGCGRKTPLQLPPTPSPQASHPAPGSHPAAS